MTLLLIMNVINVNWLDFFSVVGKVFARILLERMKDNASGTISSWTYRYYLGQASGSRGLWLRLGSVLGLELGLWLARVRVGVRFELGLRFVWLGLGYIFRIRVSWGWVFGNSEGYGSGYGSG